MRALAVAAALLGAFAAGCVAPGDLVPAALRPVPGLGPDGLSVNLSLPVVHEVASIAAHDGVALRADLFRPQVPDGERVPVIAVISPYFGGKDPADDFKSRHPVYSWLLHTLAPRGYAVALVDLRGTGGSGGCMDLGGPNEQQDAHDVVEWLGTQPWSNGKVGLIGKSYDGYTQQMAAVKRPPHLATIVPVEPVAGWYHAVGMGGAKYQLWTPATPLLYNVAIGLDPPRAEESRIAWVTRFQHADCVVENQVWSDDPTGDMNAWMKERELAPLAPQVDVPVFYLHGLLDVNAKPDHAVPWFNDLGGPTRGFFWQAPHVWPYDPHTGRGDWFWHEVHRWFDFHLLGLDNGVAETYGQVEVQDNLGRWRVEAAFPPADATNLTLVLHGGDLVPPHAGLACADPCPTARLQDWPGHAFDGPDERLGLGVTRGLESTVPAGPWELWYRSAPLAEDVHLSGVPAMRVRASFEGATGHVVALIYDEAPDGERTLVDRGVKNARHRDGYDAPKPVVPGEFYDLDLDFYPRDHVFRAGHRVVVAVAGTDADWLVPSGHVGAISVDEPKSSLALPVVHRTDFFATTWGEEQGRYFE